MKILKTAFYGNDYLFRVAIFPEDYLRCDPTFMNIFAANIVVYTSAVRSEIEGGLLEGGDYLPF